MSRRHDPALQATRARKAAADPDVQARRSRAMRAWWTPERRRARAARIAECHRLGRYPRPGRRTWTAAERAAQGARQCHAWAAGRFDHLPAVMSARAKARWQAGTYRGQSARMKALWAAGRFAGHAARHRALWRSGHWFGDRRWRGGLRAELLARFPEHAAWIEGLMNADLAGLLSEREERPRAGIELRFLRQVLQSGGLRAVC